MKLNDHVSQLVNSFQKFNLAFKKLACLLNFNVLLETLCWFVISYFALQYVKNVLKL